MSSDHNMNLTLGAWPLLEVDQIIRSTWNIHPHRPPMDLLFGNRFDNDWTEEYEQELLHEAVQKSSVVGGRDRLNLIQTSQQESVSEDVPRLSDVV
jgi:hypothetical protein